MKNSFIFFYGSQTNSDDYYARDYDFYIIFNTRKEKILVEALLLWGCRLMSVDCYTHAPTFP